MKELACFFLRRHTLRSGRPTLERIAFTEEKLKSALAGPPLGPIQIIQGYREGEMAPVISFQDRGHGMTTERRTMAFFMRTPVDFASTYRAKFFLFPTKVRTSHNPTK